MLKHMVDNLISAYTCPFCWSKNISDQNIDIIGAAWNTVNIDMQCPSCKKHFMAKTEVIQMDSTNANIDSLKKLSNTLKAIKGELGWDIDVTQELQDRLSQESKDVIKDDTIISLQKELKWKKDLSIEDLLSDQSD